MANLLCILILIVGGLNWASIGFLQYDFIAGFFGTQASIFSRIIYICVGLATFYFIFMMFKYRGSVKIFDRKRKETEYVQTRFTPENVDLSDKHVQTSQPQNMQMPNSPLLQNVSQQTIKHQAHGDDGDILS